MQHLRIMLRGKVAVITGSSSGIGAEIARKFATEQAAGITLHGRRAKALENVKNELIEAGLEENKIHIVIGDITNVQTRQVLIDQTLTKFGRLDILVNNAGFFKSSRLADSDCVQAMSEQFECNVLAVSALMQLAVVALKESHGSIINISSVVSLKVVDDSAPYATTKAAMNHLTKAAAMEFGPLGVRVNAICPGYLLDARTQGEDGFDDEKRVAGIAEYFKSSTPLRKLATAADVAASVTFLASENAVCLTGIILLVDGGWHLA